MIGKKDTLMRYRAEIDGLRALAVIPVVLFHAGFGWASGGFVGVDVFFVISGFLITSIIISELQQDQFSMTSFYERRARRILPALTFMLLTCVPASWIFLNEYELGRFADGLLGIAFFVSNIVFFKQDGYFDEASEFNPLIHTWSLAVEEQFYILFPLLLTILFRKGQFKRKYIGFTLVTLVSVSFILSIYLVNIDASGESASRAFFLLPARVWELGFGAIAAFFLQSRKGEPVKGKLSGGLAMAGIALILIPVGVYDSTTPFPGAFALTPVVGTCLVICFCDSESVAGKVLRNHMLVGIGLISYSLYLWHQPVLAFYRVLSGNLVIPVFVAIGLVAGSTLLAVTSWHFVEQPFRRKSEFSQRNVFLISSSSLLLLIGLGMMSSAASNGMEHRLARELEKSEYVFFGNVDERLFIQERLEGNLPDANTLILGSSRLMLGSSEILGREVLNLSVSGAELEDYIAFAPASVNAMRVEEVFIGADPWLLRKQDPEGGRWTSVEALFQQGIELLKAENEKKFKIENTKEETKSIFSEVMHDMYSKVTLSTLSTDTGAASSRAKRARDGSHIYAAAYQEMSDGERQPLISSHAYYKMKTFSFSDQRRERFEALLNFLKSRGVDVKLVLTPYHPDTFAIINDKNMGHLEAEAKFNDISKKLNIQIVGSYDPEKAGCERNEFFDGMHPRASCVEKFFGQ